MNGHTQSGGHWNAAFGLLARTSGNVGSSWRSSRSGDGSANGIRYIMESILVTEWRSVPWLRHQQEEVAMRDGHTRFLHFSHNSLTLWRSLTSCLFKIARV